MTVTNKGITLAEEHVYNSLSSAEKALTIRQICNRAGGYSEIYIRKCISHLEELGYVEKTDSRQPYMYIPIVKPSEAERAEKIQQMVELLLADEEPTDPVLKSIRKVPVDEWRTKVIPNLEILIEAVSNISPDDRKIPTL